MSYKVSVDDVGEEMLAGEFESMKALHTVIPAKLPTLLAHDTYADALNKHFYLPNFSDMRVKFQSASQLPSASEHLSIIVQLHQNSSSPMEKFGFHLTTYGSSDVSKM